KCIDKTKWGIRQLMPTATYRFNKTIATATISFIVTVAIVIYKGLIPVVYQMLTQIVLLSGIEVIRSRKTG
ncbi:hypothetical protein, partial [Parabacteroides sp. ZJ-118]|uniref:hypothetical protein n=1 Tax=Parabacteroides sp. ZJ-118 TaxID=2709398 RepID=UPI001980FD12